MSFINIQSFDPPPPPFSRKQRENKTCVVSKYLYHPKGGFPFIAETTRNHIFFKRNQSSDTRSHSFGAKFLL